MDARYSLIVLNKKFKLFRDAQVKWLKKLGLNRCYLQGIMSNASTITIGNIYIVYI